jgi:hypothetical protein
VALDLGQLHYRNILQFRPGLPRSDWHGASVALQSDRHQYNCTEVVGIMQDINLGENLVKRDLF